MDGCSYRLNLWPDEVSFSIARVTECPAYFHTYIRYVRIFFINANCSKTKAGSVIQRTCCLQQSTFTILWSLKGIKSNYRSGLWVVRNGSILFCERTLVSAQRILETILVFVLWIQFIHLLEKTSTNCYLRELKASIFFVSKFGKGLFQNDVFIWMIWTVLKIEVSKCRLIRLRNTF